MAQSAGSVIVEVGANTSNFDRNMRSVDDKLRRLDRTASTVTRGFGVFGRGVDRAGMSLARVSRGASSAILSFIGLRGAVLAASGGFLGGAGLVYAMQKAVSVAINVEEQINKVGVVFGSSAGVILNWSKTTATGIGLARSSALEAAGTFGNMLRPLGIIPKQAAIMSRSLVNLAGDMSSFNNASLEDTLIAIRAGLAGEVEPLRRFGVFLSEVRLKAEAIKAGFVNKGFKGVLDPLVKSLAAYNLILKDSKLAQGDYNRTSNSTANVIRTIKAQVTDLAGVFGQGLEPVVNRVGRQLRDKLADPEVRNKIAALGRAVGEKVLGALKRLGTWFDSNWEGIEGGFRTAGGALNTAATAAQKLYGWLKKLNELTPGDESVLATLLGGFVAFKGGKALARGLTKGGTKATAGRIAAGAGVARVATPAGIIAAGLSAPGNTAGRNYSSDAYPNLALLLADPALLRKHANQLAQMADGPTIAQSSPSALKKMEAFAKRHVGRRSRGGSIRGEAAAVGATRGVRPGGRNTSAPGYSGGYDPITTKTPLQTDRDSRSGSGKKTKVQHLLPASLRLGIAASEATEGTRDDLRAWKAVEDWLEARIKVTRDVNRKIQMLEELANARNKLAGLRDKASPEDVRTRMTSLFGGSFLGGEAFGIASSFGYKAKPRDLLRDLKSQNAQLTTLARSATRLRKRGAPQALISDILAGGLENADEASALAGANPKVFRQYMKAFGNRERLEERVQSMSVRSQTVNINATNVNVGNAAHHGSAPQAHRRTSTRVGARRAGR